MEISEESDSEFWDHLDDMQVESKEKNKKKTYVEGNNGILNKQFAIGFRDALISSPNQKSLWTREYFEEKIERIREAKDSELQVSTIKAWKKIQRSYENKFKQITKKHREDFGYLLSELQGLNEVLITRDEFQHVLIELLMDISIVQIKKSKNPAKIAAKITTDTEKQALADEILSLRSQLDVFKELCSNYQHQTEAALTSEKNIRAEFSIYKSSMTEELAKLKAELSDKDLLIETFTERRYKELASLKNEFNTEIQAREHLQDRQSLFIDQLQDELKNAKVVLQNKYIRNKYYDSLKDYQLDIQHKKLESKPSRSARQKKPNSAAIPHPKPLLTSTDLFPQPFASNPSKTPQRPIFSSSIFNTFDHTHRSNTPSNRRRSIPNLSQ